MKVSTNQQQKGACKRSHQCLSSSFSKVNKEEDKGILELQTLVNNLKQKQFKCPHTWEKLCIQVNSSTLLKDMDF